MKEQGKRKTRREGRENAKGGMRGGEENQGWGGGGELGGGGKMKKGEERSGLSKYIASSGVRISIRKINGQVLTSTYALYFEND